MGPYCEGCISARPYPYVTIDTAETFVVGCHAVHQGWLIAPHPDAVPRAAQALARKAVRGARLLLQHFWKCDRRSHQTVLGVTFLQMMPPASAGGPPLT